MDLFRNLSRKNGVLSQANNRQNGTNLSVTSVAGKSARRAKHSVRTYALIKERKKENWLQDSVGTPGVLPLIPLVLRYS